VDTTGSRDSDDGEQDKAAQAFLALAEAHVSPLAHGHASEDEVGFLRATEDNENLEVTALVREALAEANASA